MFHPPRRLGAALAALALSAAATAQAQPVAGALDRDAVIEHARRRSWAVRVAAARSGEARALREGASIPARENPSLQLRSGMQKKAKHHTERHCPKIFM